MMHERQLADVLISMGVERGTDIDQIAHELASQTFPSFVDEAAFKTSLLDAVESQLRRQTDEQIERLRNQLAGGAAQMGRVQLEQEAPELTEKPQQEVVTPEPPSDIEETNQTVVVDEDLPEDATMVWHTADDRKDT